MGDLLLNGRFLTRVPTGVDRVAAELADALVRRGLPNGFDRLRVVTPAAGMCDAASRPPALLARAAPRAAFGLGGALWEQVALQGGLAVPRAGSATAPASERRGATDPGDWLLSLCNSGPVLRRRQALMIHDAQVFTHPASYTAAFRAWYRLALPRIARRAGLVLTVSDHAKAELEALGIVPEGKARVARNGGDHILRAPADPGVLARHGLTPDGYLLAVGSPAPHKNLRVLREAAAERRDRRMPLVVTGGGEGRILRGDPLQATPDVLAVGRVSDAELRALYEGAAALLLPSFTEASGLPAAEAMTCGCPVVASTGGALPETCGGAALLVDPRDVAGWTDAMESLGADAALRHRMRMAGLDRAAALTWDRAAAVLSGHLDDVTGAMSAPGGGQTIGAKPDGGA